MAEQAKSQRQPENTKLVIVAVVLAVMAVILTNIYIRQIRQQNRLKSFSVYILQVHKSPGDRIKSIKKDVRQIYVPDTPTFRDTFSQMGYVDDKSLSIRISGKEPLKREARAGEILLFKHFTSPESEAIDQQISRGKRLKVLSINSKTVPVL